MQIEPIQITCQNSSCEYFMAESGKRICRNGHNSAGNQQYYCHHCGKYFIETRNTPLFHSHLDSSSVEFLVKSSVEKNPIRGVSRTTGFSRATISRYYRIFGEHAKNLNESHTVNLPPEECEMDEIWSYNKKKEKNVNSTDSSECGDCWTYTAIKRTSGFFISFSTGKRTEDTCKDLLNKLFKVMDLPFPDKKIFFFTDGNLQYEGILKELYSESCAAYGKIIKTIKGNSVLDIKRESVFGDLKGHKISTSVVEGYNNKMRQRIAPFVRKTAAFSKSLKSHIAKINVFIFANNFIEKKMEWNGLKKIKERTPAMIEGIATHVWTWREFLQCNAVSI